MAYSVGFLYFVLFYLRTYLVSAQCDYDCQGQVVSPTGNNNNNVGGATLVQPELFGYLKVAGTSVCGTAKFRPVVWPQVDSKIVFVACEDKVLRVSAAATGFTVENTTVLDSPITGDLYVTGSYVAAVTASKVYLLSAEGLSVIWEEALETIGNPTIGSSDVFVGAQNPSRIYRLSKAGSEGSALSKSFVEIPSPVLGSPVVNGAGDAYFCTSSSLVKASATEVRQSIPLTGCSYVILSGNNELTVAASDQVLILSNNLQQIRQKTISSTVNSLSRRVIRNSKATFEMLYVASNSGIDILNAVALDDAPFAYANRGAVKSPVAVYSNADVLFATGSRILGLPKSFSEAEEEAVLGQFFEDDEGTSGSANLFSLSPLILSNSEVVILKDDGVIQLYKACEYPNVEGTEEIKGLACPRVIVDKGALDTIGIVIATAAAVLVLPLGFCVCRKAKWIRSK